MLKKRPRGRPPNRQMTPMTLLANEMRESAKLNKQMRTLLGKVVGELEKELTAELPLERKLLVLEALSNGLQNHAKSLESAAKHVVKENAEIGGEEATEEGILDELRG